MTAALGRTDIEQFRTIVTGQLGLQYEDGILCRQADLPSPRSGYINNLRDRQF